MTRDTTLLELVTTLWDCMDSERDVIATVVTLVNTGRVRLIGTFKGTRFRALPAEVEGPRGRRSATDRTTS